MLRDGFQIAGGGVDGFLGLEGAGPGGFSCGETLRGCFGGQGSGRILKSGGEEAQEFPGIAAGLAAAERGVGGQIMGYILADGDGVGFSHVVS